MEGLPLGVRKGAWTEEEDLLLKKCIEIHGEGKWHQVPSKAGLNRCRKSCRLRWLNYLKPNIKRGDFEDDEVDLIIRLHKLLGNRWSLIAGRLPGRTANDVKNYWNTHLLKKFNPNSTKESKQLLKAHNPRDQDSSEQPAANNNSNNDNVVTIIKPRPRTLHKKSFIRFNNNDNNNNNNDVATTSFNDCLGEVDGSTLKSYYSNPTDNDDEIMWWENLLMMNDKEVQPREEHRHEDEDGFFNYSGNKVMSGILGMGHHHAHMLNSSLDGEEILGDEGISNVYDDESNKGTTKSWDQLFCDAELWDVYNPEPDS